MIVSKSKLLAYFKAFTILTDASFPWTGTEIKVHSIWGALLFNMLRISWKAAPSELVIIPILLGYFIWNDYLSIKGFFGLLLIILASFFTLYREYVLKIKINTDKTIR